MSQTDTKTSERRVWRISRTSGIAVIVIMLLVSLVILKPAAPNKIVLLTGPEGAGYNELGERYAVFLRAQGLEVEVKITDGGFDNVKRLVAGAKNTLAFAPSNIEHVFDDAVDSSHLVSLGSVAYEPLWLFYRSGLDVRWIPDLAGLTVATGTKGAVVEYIASHLQELNRISQQVRIDSSEGQTPETVAKALIEGDIHAVFATGGPRTPNIRMLLEDENLDVLSFDRADAYQAMDPGITTIVVPEGVFDLATNIPSKDLALLSATTNLITLDDFNAGSVPLLLQTSANIHDQQRMVASGGDFPNPQNVSLPLKRAADRYYKQGEKGLSKFLPYSVTRWLNHLSFVVLPLLTLAVVLFKIVPLSLTVWITIKLKGFFKRLENVEKSHAAGVDQAQLLVELDALDHASATIFVPRSRLQEYIDFRQFLHDMRDRVES